MEGIPGGEEEGAWESTDEDVRAQVVQGRAKKFIYYFFSQSE